MMKSEKGRKQGVSPAALYTAMHAVFTQKHAEERCHLLQAHADQKNKQ